MEHSFLTRPRIRMFIIRFFSIFILVELLLTLAPPLAYQEWLAATLGNILTLPVNGTLLSVEGIRFEISAFCTGLTTWGLFLGLLYGFPFPRGGKKVLYAATGLVLIVFINFFRLLAIVYVGKTVDANAVELLHTLTWFAMSAAVMGMWYSILCVHAKTKNATRVADFLLGE